MPAGKGKKIIQITLPEFHISKLDMGRKQLNLSKSEQIQRLIEDWKVFELGEETPGQEKEPGAEEEHF